MSPRTAGRLQNISEIISCAPLAARLTAHVSKDWKWNLLVFPRLGKTSVIGFQCLETRRLS